MISRRVVDFVVSGCSVGAVVAGVASDSAFGAVLAIAANALAPGLAALRFLAPGLRGSLGFAAALGFSPVVSGVFVTILMLAGSSCSIAAHVTLLASALALGYASIRPIPATDDAPRLGTPAWLLAALTTSLIAWPLAVSDRVRTSIHGMLHSAILFEARAGGVPPHNPFFAGGDLRYYWTWHLGAAVPVEIAGADPLVVFACGNVAAWLAFALVLGHLARHFACELWTTAPSRVAALGVLLGVCSLNPLGAWFFERNATELGEQFSPLERLAQGDDVVRYVQALAVGQDERISATLTKFFNVSSFPAALALLALSWLFAARLAARANRADFLGVLFAIAGCIALSPLTGLTGGLALGLGGGTALLTVVFDRERRTGLVALLAALAAGAVAAAPFVAMSGGDDSGSLKIVATLEKARADLLALGPALLVAAPLCWVALRRSIAARTLVIAGVSLLPLAIVLRFPVNSEYKLVREAAPLLGVFAALTVEWLLRDGKRPLAILGLLVATAFVPTNAIAWNAYRWSSKVQLDLRFDGAAFTLDPTRHPVTELYAWLRANTPRDAVLLDDTTALTHFAGPFHGAEPPSLAQRAVFADEPSYMNDYEPDVLKRRATRNTLFAGNALAPDDVRRLESFGSRLYAIVRADSPRESASLRGIAATLRFEKVYEGPAGKVYRWRTAR